MAKENTLNLSYLSIFAYAGDLACLERKCLNVGFRYFQITITCDFLSREKEKD